MRAEAGASLRVPWTLVALGIAGAALLAFLFLASRIAGGDAFAFDHSIILSLRMADDPATPIGSARFTSAVRDVTALGSSTVLTIVTLLAIAFLLLRGLWRTAALVAVATAGGAWAITLVKGVVGRTRPDVVGHLMDEHSLSFPSGHAGNAAIVYLTVATLILPMVREAHVRGFVIAAAAVLVALIGASRVYLGVHWPSDVLAGWIFGVLWALGWWRIEIAWFRDRSPRWRRPTP